MFRRSTPQKNTTKAEQSTYRETRTTYKHAPAIGFSLAPFSHSFRLCTASPTITPAAFKPPFAKGMLTCYSRIFTEPEWEDNPSVALNYDFLIKKEVLPTPGKVFVGLPGEAAPLTSQYTLQLRSSGHFDKGWVHLRKRELHFDIEIADFVVVITPMSMVQQAIHLLGSVGGILTILSSVFYSLFVKKFQHTHQEKQSAELTLIGFHADGPPQQPLLHSSDADGGSNC